MYYFCGSLSLIDEDMIEFNKYGDYSGQAIINVLLTIWKMQKKLNRKTNTYICRVQSSEPVN